MQGLLARGAAYRLVTGRVTLASQSSLPAPSRRIAPMPQFDVTVPHGQSKDDAHERLKSFSEKVKEHYADMVKDVEQQWEGDTLHFGFKTMGVGIKGDLVVNENDVRVRGDLPFTAMMFKGKIESALRDEITRLLG